MPRLVIFEKIFTFFLHLKPFFSPQFPFMRLRRVLVLNKWRRFAPPDKHTPMQLNSTHYTRKMKARRRAMLPLHRLQSCALFRLAVFHFYALYYAYFHSVYFSEFAYCFSRNFADIFAFVPTRKIVKKKQLFILDSYCGGNVFVHNVGYEKLR